MIRNPLADDFTLTQSWETHLLKAGKTLGGEDYATPYGTPLPVLDGVVEWVTPKTKRPPAWYNPGLGNAVAYLRRDGTRTVYGHCSAIDGRQAYSGNSGTVRPAPTPGNPHAGSHVHVHDVAADGTTRLRPFTTATPARHEEEEDMLAPKVVIRTDGDTEGMLVAPWLDGPSDLERGYRVSTNPKELAAWARMFAGGVGNEHARVTRDGGYTDIQATARVLREQWKRNVEGTTAHHDPIESFSITLTGTATPKETP